MSVAVTEMLRAGHLPCPGGLQLPCTPISELECKIDPHITFDQLIDASRSHTSLFQSMASANVFCRQHPHYFKFLLLEHGETPPKQWHVKQGGSSVLQQAMGRFMSTKEIVDRRQNGSPGSKMLGLNPPLTQEWLSTKAPLLERRLAELHRYHQIDLEIPAVTSGLRRTQDTASAVGLTLGEQYMLDELSERNLGPLSGLTITQIRDGYPDLHKAIMEGRELDHPDIEPAQRVRYRVKSGIARAMSFYTSNSGNAPEFWIPLVGHQTTLQALISMLEPVESRRQEWDIEIGLGSLSTLVVAIDYNQIDEAWAKAGRPIWKDFEASPLSINELDAHYETLRGPEGDFRPDAPLATLHGRALLVNDRAHFSEAT